MKEFTDVEIRDDNTDELADAMLESGACSSFYDEVTPRGTYFVETYPDKLFQTGFKRTAYESLLWITKQDIDLIKEEADKLKTLLDEGVEIDRSTMLSTFCLYHCDRLFKIFGEITTAIDTSDYYNKILEYLAFYYEHWDRAEVARGYYRTLGNEEKVNQLLMSKEEKERREDEILGRKGPELSGILQKTIEVFEEMYAFCIQCPEYQEVLEHDEIIRRNRYIIDRLLSGES